MPETTGYSVASYGDMIVDKIRMPAYAEALRRSIAPGSVVVDIGAGTGIASLLACRYGARHVYAIEPDNAIEVARACAVANGCADKITFLQANSLDVSLPEPADVMVSDLRGVLPLLQHHIPSIRDARARLLKPGGVQIPAIDRLCAVPVENAEAYARCDAPWRQNEFGFDLGAGRRRVVNDWWRVRLKAEHLLAAPGSWANIDYRTVEQTRVAGHCEYQAERAGTFHGWVLWFETELYDGIGYSNSPLCPEVIYGQAFFPLEESIEVAAGDSLRLDVSADLVGDEYIWRWNSEIDAKAASAGRRRFSQSTFHGMSFAPQRLAMREGASVPRLDKRAGYDRAALELLDGGTSLAAAAHALQSRFPDRFEDTGIALTFLADLVGRYRSDENVA